MAIPEERAWTRWQDWATLTLGVGALLSPVLVPLVSESDPEAFLTVLGMVLIVTSLWSLGAPQSVSSEWLHAISGALLFIAPWMVGYTAETGAAWMSWTIGLLTMIVAATAIPLAAAVHRDELADHRLA